MCVMTGGKTPRLYTRILKYLEASPWFWTPAAFDTTVGLL